MPSPPEGAAKHGPIAAKVTRRELTADRRGIRVEWRCGRCGAKGTPADSMFKLPPRECDACGVMNDLETRHEPA